MNMQIDEKINQSDGNLGNMAEELRKLREEVTPLPKREKGRTSVLQLLAYQWVMIQFLVIVWNSSLHFNSMPTNVQGTRSYVSLFLFLTATAR